MGKRVELYLLIIRIRPDQLEALVEVQQVDERTAFHGHVDGESYAGEGVKAKVRCFLNLRTIWLFKC